MDIYENNSWDMYIYIYMMGFRSFRIYLTKPYRFMVHIESTNGVLLDPLVYPSCSTIFSPSCALWIRLCILAAEDAARHEVLQILFMLSIC